MAFKMKGFTYPGDYEKVLTKRNDFKKDFKKAWDASTKTKTKKKLSAKDLKGKTSKEVADMLLKQGFRTTPPAEYDPSITKGTYRFNVKGGSPIKQTKEVKKAAADLDASWKSSKEYKNLTNANAPADVIAKRKDTFMKKGTSFKQKTEKVGRYEVKSGTKDAKWTKKMLKKPSKSSRTFDSKEVVKKNLAKKAGKTTAKTVTKSVIKKLLPRVVPGAGYALAANDVYQIGKLVKDGSSIKSAIKKHYLGT
jgi:hypothetical protein